MIVAVIAFPGPMPPETAISHHGVTVLLLILTAVLAVGGLANPPLIPSRLWRLLVWVTAADLGLWVLSRRGDMPSNVVWGICMVLAPIILTALFWAEHRRDSTDSGEVVGWKRLPGLWRALRDYLPTWNPPKRRPRLRRRRSTEERDRSLIAAGQMGGRLAQALPGLDVVGPEIKPGQVGWTLRSKQSADPQKEAAEVAKQPPRAPSELARAAAGLPTVSQQLYEESTKKRDLASARQLQAEGKRLHEELWAHADAAKQRPFGSIPGVYLGQAEDWYKRFRELAQRHLSRKALALETEPYPVWQGAIGALAMAAGSQKLVEDIDKMFHANLRVLDQIERRLT